MSSQIAVVLILALFGFGQESRPELLLWQDGTSHSDSFYIDGHQMRSIEHDGTTISTFGVTIATVQNPTLRSAGPEAIRQCST